jgi:hypothetical protein
MEIFGLLDLCGCFLDLAAFSGLFADVLTFIGGKSNRKDRLKASAAGDPKPPLDRWNWAFLILTPIVVFLVLLVILKWFGRPRA